MRFIHVADLHIGKNVNGFSMIDEQRYILDDIVSKVKDQNCDAIVIAGDVYDKRNPSDEAVTVFNDFIINLSKLDVHILIVSGNHDAGDKLEFLSGILSKNKIHIVGSYNGSINKVDIEDDYGVVNFYLMPFIKAINVRVYDNSVDSYHDAIKSAIEHSNIDPSERNVFVGHQFFSSGSESISDSEVFSVGGIDNVGYQLLEDFDYAALGHLHRPQFLKHEYIRYSGSPIKYSYSEVNDVKSLVVVDLEEKGKRDIKLIDLESKTKFREVVGYIDDILHKDYDVDNTNDFVFVILKDEHEVVDAIGKLKNKYSNLMTLTFDNKRYHQDNDIDVVFDVKNQNPIELFEDFYQSQNNTDLNERQKTIVKNIMEEIL